MVVLRERAGLCMERRCLIWRRTHEPDRKLSRGLAESVDISCRERFCVHASIYHLSWQSMVAMFLIGGQKLYLMGTSCK